MIVQCDIQKNSFIAGASTSRTGAPVWRTTREEIPSWSTPAIFEHDGRAELVTQATTFIRGYDPSTGKELWRLVGNSEIAIPTPIIGPGLIIVTNGYARRAADLRDQAGRVGRHHAQGRADGERRHRLEHESRRTVHPDARSSMAAGSTSSPINGVLAGIRRSAPGSASTRNASSGGGSFSASPVAADGKLYSRQRGRRHVRRQGGAGRFELLAKNPMGEVIMATPAIAERRHHRARAEGRALQVGRLKTVD